MRGHVRKRGSTWTYVLDVGQGGRRKQSWHGGFRTRREAERALAEALVRLEEGRYVEPTKQVFGDFLEEWLAAIRPTVRASTWESYERNVRLHIRPGLGSTPLRNLSPGHLNAFYEILRKEGSRRVARRGLSARTVRYVHVIIHRALRDAVRWGRLTRNVANLADPPATVRPQMRVWSAEQLRTFVRFTAGDRLHAAFLLLIATGMRRGEIAGLRWDDVDLEDGHLSVDTAHACRGPLPGRGRAAKDGPQPAVAATGPRHRRCSQGSPEAAARGAACGRRVLDRDGAGVHA